MATMPTIHPNSFLGRMCAHQPLITSAGKELLRRVPFHRWDERMGRRVLTHAALVSVDNGNDAFKGAILHVREPFLRTKRMVTAYAPARTIRGGEGVIPFPVVY